jgi:hypothetical protein
VNEIVGNGALMHGTETRGRLLRVLCLHGYAQNGELFRARTGALRKHLKATCEFTFVDAPHLATAGFVDTAPTDEAAGAASKLA